MTTTTNKTNDMELINNLLAKANELLNTLTGFVVCGKHHIEVNGKGINETGFDVLTISTLENARLYNTESDAEFYGMDYYLRDGKNYPIQLSVRRVEDVIKEQINIIEKFVAMFKA